MTEKQSSKPNTELSDLEILNKYENSVNKDKPFILPGFWNSLFFSYMNRIVDAGTKKPFDFDMTYKPLDFLVIENLFKSFNATPGKSFISRYLKMMGCSQVMGAITIATGYFSQIPIPILIGKFLEWYQDPDAEFKYGLYYAGFFCLIAMVKPMIGERSLIYTFRNSVAVSGILIVRKFILKVDFN